MQVVIRTDASIDVGTGHVMRCLALAGRLRDRGDTILFLSREHEGDLCKFVEEQGYVVARLPAFPIEIEAQKASSCSTATYYRWQEDADQTRTAIIKYGARPDLLVVDHYGLGRSWESALRPLVGRIFVLDDLANRGHDCDVLLDQNLHDSPGSRYLGLVRESARVFVGPQYALLRPEFDDVAPRLRDFGLHRMLVFFGGTDPSNEALKLVSALRLLGENAPSTKVVLGPANPHEQVVRRAAAGIDTVEVIRVTNRMARLVVEADLGIGTCGVAAWERCKLGLPALVVVNEDSQCDDARLLHELNAVRNLGDAVNTSVERWVAEIRTLQNDPMALREMSRAAAMVMRGRDQAVREFWQTLLS